MAVKHDPWFGALNVVVECDKSDVDVLVSLVYQPRRIVRDKNIDGGKRVERSFDFGLFVKKMSTRFVAPSAIEAAESQTSYGMNR